VAKFRAEATPESLRRQMEWKQVYVVEEGTQILATGALADYGKPDAPRLCVSQFYVQPHLHRQGIGKRLLSHLIGIARAGGCRRLHVPSSRNAVPFYASSGFSVDAAQPDAADEITWMSADLGGIAEQAGAGMERAEWLQQMRTKAEALYDHLSPEYWVNWGLRPDETHREFIQKLLLRLPPKSALLSAACGAGRYDGLLLEAGHSVVGIDQSAGMLARAREHLPEARYEKMGLQEMDFREAFDGAICIDAMEHICPEDWPGIMRRLGEALKPGGVLYFTVEIPDTAEVDASYRRARAMGLPVVFGELADAVEASYERVRALRSPGVPGDVADVAVYHYYPSLEQVRAWIAQAGLAIEEEGTGNGYEHLLVRRT